MRRPDPPGGQPPPASAPVGEAQLDLVPLAREVCDRYYAAFPDHMDRYGEPGVAWCRHDNQWILFWAARDVDGMIDVAEQARWLARVLGARDFPVDRLVRNLELAAAVARERVPVHGSAMAAALERAARAIST